MEIGRGLGIDIKADVESLDCLFPLLGGRPPVGLSSEKDAQRGRPLLPINNPVRGPLGIRREPLLDLPFVTPKEETPHGVLKPKRFREVAYLNWLPNKSTLELGDADLVIHGPIDQFPRLQIWIDAHEACRPQFYRSAPALISIYSLLT